MQVGIGLSLTRAGGWAGWPTSNDLDLFIVAGQSNAVGVGDKALAPTAPSGRYITGSTISYLVPPQGSENTASAWQSFSNEWARRTGRKSAFVYTAVVASSLVAAGTGWHPTGTLRAIAKDAANTAISAIASSSYTPGNVYFLWIQGEAEALTYDGVTISAATYQSALEALADYFKAQVPSMVKMGVVSILGTGSGAAITAQAAAHQGYEQIRSAQTAAVAANANLQMLYDGSHHLLALGGLSDGTHYKQSTYNLIGKMAARQLASARPAPAAISPFIQATAYNDSSYSVKASRTAAHTTASTTTCLIVAATATFTDANVSGFGGTCTFNGVAMRAAASSNVSSNSPVGNVTITLYILDTTLYGGSLASLTGDIVVTPPNNMRVLDWCVIDAKDVEAMVDAEAGDFSAPASPGGTTATTTIARTYYPTLIVTAAAAVAASASPLTCTMSGATEVMDHGLGNGTLNGQIAVGYSAESATVTAKAITTTWSANCTHRAQVTIALRRSLDEERG